MENSGRCVLEYPKAPAPTPPEIKPQKFSSTFVPMPAGALRSHCVRGRPSFFDLAKCAVAPSGLTIFKNRKRRLGKRAHLELSRGCSGQTVRCHNISSP